MLASIPWIKVLLNSDFKDYFKKLFYFTETFKCVCHVK